VTSHLYRERGGVVLKITRIQTGECGETHFDKHQENGVETQNYADYTRAIDA
jgi:hypothetical protein